MSRGHCLRGRRESWGVGGGGGGGGFGARWANKCALPRWRKERKEGGGDFFLKKAGYPHTRSPSLKQKGKVEAATAPLTCYYFCFVHTHATYVCRNFPLEARDRLLRTIKPPNDDERSHLALLGK